jgi:hypothetical protein
VIFHPFLPLPDILILPSSHKTKKEVCKKERNEEKIEKKLYPIGMFHPTPKKESSRWKK